MRPVLVIVAGLVVGFNAALVIPARWLVASPPADHAAEVWACPMMCVRVDHAGTCPVCGMELQRVAGDGGAVAVTAEQASLLGLQTAEVRKRRLVRTVHGAGVVEATVEDPGVTAQAGRALSVKVELFEQDLVWIAVGQGATVTFDLGPGLVFDGAVAAVAATVKPETRTTTVTISVAAVDARIRVGALATIAIEAGIDAGGSTPAVSLQGRYTCRLHQQVHVDAPGTCPVCGLTLAIDARAGAEAAAAGPEVLSIPRDAIVGRDGRYLAYVRGADGHYQPRDVTIGVRAGDWIAVRGGLSEGEVVATHGSFFLDAHLELAGAPRAP